MRVVRLGGRELVGIVLQLRDLGLVEYPEGSFRRIRQHIRFPLSSPLPQEETEKTSEDRQGYDDADHDSRNDPVWHLFRPRAGNGGCVGACI